MTRVTWRLEPLDPPAVLRRCPRCNIRQRFVSADKFRVNGSGRRLDVWLVYRCVVCEQTWNCTILTRVSPESIPEPLYQGFMDNDEATAHRYAFDRELMRKNGSELEPTFEYRVDGEPVQLAELPAGDLLDLAIDFDFPLNHVRLDTFLAQRLEVPRRVLDNLFASGELRVEPAIHDQLAKKLKRPVVVHIDVDAARRELSSVLEARSARDGAAPDGVRPIPRESETP